jgi:hypothetical protein
MHLVIDYPGQYPFVLGVDYAVDRLASVFTATHLYDSFALDEHVARKSTFTLYDFS